MRPARARLAPIPIITRPPAPPTACIRRGERASQVRAVPATSAQVLSQNTAIATKIGTEQQHLRGHVTGRLIDELLRF